MIIPHSEHVKPSRYIASTSVKLPILWPQRASSVSIRYGMRLIDSMPPASTTSDSPSMIDCAPRGNRLHSRRARLVDRLRRHRIGKSRAPDDLARRVGPRAGLAAVPKERLVYLRRFDAAALQRCPRRDGPESAG